MLPVTTRLPFTSPLLANERGCGDLGSGFAAPEIPTVPPIATRSEKKPEHSHS
jgi:hypothetical protein